MKLFCNFVNRAGNQTYKVVSSNARQSFLQQCCDAYDSSDLPSCFGYRLLQPHPRSCWGAVQSSNPGKYWVSLFAHSPRVRLLWKERTGQSATTYSETRWWSKWEVLQQVMLLFGDVLPLQENVDISPATRGKLLAIFSNPQNRAYLLEELAVVIDIGEHFVKATYNMEGDGPLIFSCFEILSTVHAAVISAHLPNTNAVIRQLSASSPASIPQWMMYARSCEAVLIQA